MPTTAPADAPAPGRRAGRRPWSRRLTTWIGLAMVAGGLGMLGYVGWQFWGTNWTSQRAQAEVTGELQRQWERGGEQLAPKYLPEGSASALIRIPKFGDDYVVPVLEGMSDEVLSSGYGHFRDTADPGEVGNYALAAHRVTHGEPLRRMPELRPGDEVIVETAEATFTYELDTDPNELVIPFTGVWVLDDVPRNPDGGVQPAQEAGQRLITLTTCSELFHTDDRMIAFGHLVDRQPKT
ncbi:class E sortase [Nocardioides aequoreus]|uniref:class E sortase n=1 Tax=Nocardioides aequoreus TaxID=397278 RepID=UPI0014702826|nr:class E sortase [Nocardioides aequoreus]